MSESYGHRITAIHANPNNKCDHCRQPALWETDYKFFGENEPRGSNPEQVCNTHAKEFAAKWPDAKFPGAGAELGCKRSCVMIEKVVPKVADDRHTQESLYAKVEDP